MTKVLVRVLALAAVAASFAVGASPAAAAPCWQEVIADWSDNSRVDRRYPVHCYQDALRNLPQDMRDYSSAPDDISRAMRQEIARQNSASNDDSGSGGSGGSSGSSSGGSGGSSGSGGDKNTNNGSAAPDEPVLTEPSPAVIETPETGPINEAIDRIGPSDANSLPLPIIVLASIALLLMAAGAAGLLARRLHAARLRGGGRTS